MRAPSPKYEEDLRVRRCVVGAQSHRYRCASPHLNMWPARAEWACAHHVNGQEIHSSRRFRVWTRFDEHEQRQRTADPTQQALVRRRVPLLPHMWACTRARGCW